MAEVAILKGTPYSLPSEASGSLDELRSRLHIVRTDLQKALESARRMGLVREMDRAHGYSSVFESNSIEFEGPDLAGTVEVIESDTGQRVLRDLNINLLPEVLQKDRRAFAAIGLETARVLALRYIGGDVRGLCQSDVRSLHGVLMAGEWFAGRYRQFDAAISGSDHAPYPTYEIPFAMAELCDWSQGPVEGDLAVLRAAVGHAWFTHVHPFQDGNGRVGRLIANVLLGQDGLPPAIVKARSQRSRYIAALAHSDEGGDIMPLVGLFLKTIERYVSELQRPKAFKRLFDQLVARRGSSYFDWYRNSLSDFMSRLSSELELFGLRLTLLDELSQEVFADLRGGQRQTVMTALITDGDGQDLVLYQRPPSTAARNRFSADERVPTVAFALPNEQWKLEPYRRTKRADLDGLADFWVQPDQPTSVFIDGRAVRSHSVADGASLLAEQIRRGFARRFELPPRYFDSARWLPKIHGGPG
ncbi:Fic family protein [Kribbella ginsengisoli]|uniref:Fido domain-containing protein n=1 Tax=Kribbella ginsengisoli TaxID=363865 RepID=A0ABP6X487_9ACTN